MLSNMSVLSALTSIVSPSSDHAGIQKCRSDMRCRSYPKSLLPSLFLGTNSLIRNGLEAAMQSLEWCSPVSTFLTSGQDLIHQPRQVDKCGTSLFSSTTVFSKSPFDGLSPLTASSVVTFRFARFCHTISERKDCWLRSV